MNDEEEFLTYSQIAARFYAFPKRTLMNLVAKRHKNGFDQCIKKNSHGRGHLVSLPKFRNWLKNYRNSEYFKKS